VSLNDPCSSGILVIDHLRVKQEVEATTMRIASSFTRAW
jgi:hypothetical protein